MHIGRISLLLLLLFSLIYAEENRTAQDINETLKKELEAKKALKEQLDEKLQEINSALNGDNIWLKKYANYFTFKNIEAELDALNTEIEKLTKKKRLKEKEEEELKTLTRQKELLQNQKLLLKEYDANQFRELIQPDEITDIPVVENPVAVIGAFSYIKQLKQKKESHQKNLNQLKAAKNLLYEKEELLKKLLELAPTNQHYIEQSKYVKSTLEEFEQAQDIFNTTIALFNKKADEIIISLSEQIKVQGIKALYIVGIVFLLFMFSVLIKLGTKKYINDNERLYTANKIVNFINVTLIILILLFAYLENVSYLVTVLGFASAGLAIAMKDLFMSILGWIVIVLGGSIHVGDRVKVKKDGLEYVGDVLDVSLLRITIQEDITLTTYMVNRRAGRIIFIPNNYIFTTLISNYTHASMKTVWDGIDLNITYDSNFKKAMQIAREITKKYSKGYTDITRKQLNMLRDKYSLRNTNVEPRVYSFIEPYGIRISIWYLTNAYATLTLRSTICGDFIEAIQNEDDIHIAYPTSSIKMDGRLEIPKDLPRIDEETLSR